MPSPTAQVPTLEQFDASRKAITESYNRLEAIQWLLETAHEAAHEAAFTASTIDFTIDDALIGQLYRYLSDVDAEISQHAVVACTIRDLVCQLDLDGRDLEIRNQQEASVDA